MVHLMNLALHLAQLKSSRRNSFGSGSSILIVHPILPFVSDILRCQSTLVQVDFPPNSFWAALNVSKSGMLLVAPTTACTREPSFLILQEAPLIGFSNPLSPSNSNLHSPPLRVVGVTSLTDMNFTSSYCETPFDPNCSGCTRMTRCDFVFGSSSI